MAKKKKANEPKTKRQERRNIVKLWETLDIPKHNWDEINKTGNLRYLIKDPKKFNAKNVDREIFVQQYYKLMDEFLELLGDDPERAELIEMKRALVRARVLYIMGDQFQLNWIEVYEAQIIEALKNYDDVDPEIILIQASKWLGNGIIDTKKIS